MKIFWIMCRSLIYKSIWLRYVFIILGCMSPAVYALKTDAAQLIHIQANGGTLDQKNMVSVISGNVIITQGSMVVHANTARVSQDKDGHQTISLVGNPVTFSQLNDDGEVTRGQGNTFDYNTKNNLAILTGRARITKGANLVMGDKLTYNTQTQIFTAVSNNANGISTTKSGRVTIILQPNQKGQNGTNSKIKLQ